MINKINTFFPLQVINQAVAMHYNVSPKEIFNRVRKEKTIEMRQIFFALARDLNKNHIPFNHIGSYCEKYNIKAFDHATVLHNAQKADDYRQTEIAYDLNYNKVKSIAIDLNATETELTALKSEIINKVMEARSKETIKTALAEISI